MLETAIPCFSLRTSIKPGLTGWAQVTMNYAGTVAETSRKVEYDFYYLKHADMKLDLAILVKTIRVVLSLRGQ